MKKIILINGSGGCGKSTFIKFCCILNENVVELSTVDYVKKVAKPLGWDGGKTERDRAFLHDLKMALERFNDSPNLSVINSVMNEVDKEIFFVNVREIDGIKKLQKIFKTTLNCEVYTLLVRNPNIEEIKSNEADANVNNYEYDYIINNNGTMGQLLDKAGDFLKKICNSAETL